MNKRLHQENLYKDLRLYGFCFFKKKYRSVIVEPAIGKMVRMFANDPGNLGSISSRVIPKTQKMILDASLLNTQHYKVQIKCKVEQSSEKK